MVCRRYLGESTATNSAWLILILEEKIMASFVYNHYRSDKVFDLAESQKQWYDYLQKKEFHDDLTKSLKSEGESYRKELQRNAELASKDMNALRQEFSQASERQLEAIHEQTRAISESADMICGTLDEGFSEVTGRLDDISAMLDWRLSAVEDQLRISNLLLGNITLLLRVPDFQKERQYYIEQGFKHYKNATLDSDIYEDALKNLLEAEIRETTDYVVLHRIGMIYLYADKEEILNLTKAEEYFRRAAKYAIVESNPDAQQTLNLLAGDTRQHLSAQATTPEAAKAVAAKAYFQAGVACYAQGKFDEALQLSSKAFSLMPTFLEAGFIGAKSLARLGKPGKSAEVLYPLIQTDRFYSIKTVSDADLATQPEVQTMLQQLRNNAIHEASEKIARIKQEILPDSQAKPFIPEIENLLSKKTYLDTLKALDELTKKRNWDTTLSIHYFKNDFPLKTTFLKHDGKLLFLQFSPDASILVTYSSDNKLRIWDSRTGELLHELDYERDDRSSSGKHSWFKGVFKSNHELLTNDITDGVQLWDTKVGKLIHRCSKQNFEIDGEVGIFQSFSPDGLMFFTRSKSGIVYLWETESFKIIRNLSDSFGQVLFIKFSPDSSMIVSADKNHGLRFWDTYSGELSYTISAKISESTGGITNKSRFSPDNTMFVLMTTPNGSKQVYNLMNGSLVLQLAGNNSFARQILELNSTSELIVTDLPKSDDKQVLISVDIITGKQTYELPESDYVRDVAFSHDDTLLITCDSIKEEIKFWDVTTGDLINTLKLKIQSERQPFVLSSDGRSLAIMMRDESVCLCQGQGSLLLSIEDFLDFEKQLEKQLFEKQQKTQQRKARNQVERRKQEQIHQIIKKADYEVLDQDKKWFGKNYSQAISLYEQSAKLGSNEARQKLTALKQRIGLS